MRVRVDRDRCQGHAMCNALAGEIFEVTDEGFNEMGEFEVPDDRRPLVDRGSRACPERAIAVLEDAVTQENP